MHSRRYSAFISYRHADNTQEGRRWAEWLHRGLERYVVPPDLIGTPNLRGEPIRDSLYPIFRDEDELPANADLATGIRAALEVSDHLIVLCSPRSAVSPWVRKEVREFKELGRSDRILAIIIAGEPNADDPAKAREGILRDEECFCEELRFGAVRNDGTLDWTARTEPTAADLRSPGTRAEGFVTAEAYREYLTLNSSLTPEKITARTEAYRQQLDQALLKVAAGMLGVPLGQLINRDAAHRAELARKELERSQAEASRLRTFNRRLAVAAAVALVLALLAGWFWWRAKEERIVAVSAQEEEKVQREKATAAAMNAETQANNAKVALKESNRQLERSQVEEGRAWLERGRAALSRGDYISALMLAGRALGYQGYGRKAAEQPEFEATFPLLLGASMQDPKTEKERAEEAAQVTQFIDSMRPTNIPLWASAKDAVACVAFSPDSTLIATGSFDHTIKIWDTVSGRQRAHLRGHLDRVCSIAFSPDGSRLASSSDDHTIKMWDVASSNELVSIRGHSDKVRSVTFSPDGSRLVSGSSDDSVKIWDSSSGRELSVLRGHTDSVNSVSFSPDGSLVASGSDDHTIKLWNPSSRKEIFSLKGHTSLVCSVAFSPDSSRIASGSLDHTIRVWDVNSGQELISLKGHTSIVSCVIFSPDGSRIVSGSFDGTIITWDVSSGKELSYLGQNGWVSSIAFNCDGSRLASAANDHTANDHTIRLWDVAANNSLASLQGHTFYVHGVAFSPDGSFLASGSWDRSIKLWDAASGKELASLQGHTSEVHDVVFSPDGSRLASSSDDHTIKLWDTDTGREFASLKGHKGRVWSVAFSPNGSLLVSGSFDNTVKIWNAASGKELATLKGHALSVNTVVFSPDGLRIASSSHDDTIKLWNVFSHEETATLRGHSSMVNNIRFSPDGSRLASASNDQTIKLWDASSGEQLASLAAHTEAVWNIAYSPDGSCLASESRDGAIKLWDTTSGEELATTPPEVLANAKQLLATSENRLSPDRHRMAERSGNVVFIVPNPQMLDLTAPFRAGLIALPGRELQFPEIKQTTPMQHVRQDTLAQLADPKLTPERRAELRMELCTKSSQFRAATALWQRLLQGEWPGFEGASLPKDQAPARIPADSPIRRLYLLALIDATKHPQIHGHPTICQTAAQIAPVLTKEMMATPTISLAMMSLMQELAKDDSPDMSPPRATLLKRLEEMATTEWLAMLRESAGK